MRLRFLLTTVILCFALVAQAQDVTVTGSVTSSDDGTELVGVNVFVKGTTTGTITDVNGNYSLGVSGEDAVLVYSYVGYVVQEITVGNQRTIDVVLQVDVAALDEVVVVGYGTLMKSDVTGALASVSSDNFELQPLTRLDQALKGRASGVEVTQTSGQPGAGYKIRIRGANSISGNNTPLYVVDGLVVGDINSINVNDIASMEVLKDASATAIYGSRGANGVVLVTTKTGSRGPAVVEFETFYGVANKVQSLPFMTPAEFAEGVNDYEGYEVYTPEAIADLRAGGGENWEERFFRPGPYYNVQLSVHGGSDVIDYYISGNIFDETGTIINQDYKRYALRANVNAKLSDKIKIGLNTYVSREDFNGARANLAYGLAWDPTTPAYDENGDYNYVPLIPGIGNGSINPMVVPENNVREDFDHQIISNGYFNWDILESLELNISGGIERVDRVDNRYTSLLVNNTGTATVTNQDVTRMQNTNRLTYRLNNPNHRLQIDAIHEQQLVTRVWTEANGRGFFSDQTSYKNLALASVQRISNSSESESLQSFLGRVNYSLLDRFLFTASIRADGSSKFQEDNRWGYFPSGSVAWRMSEEAFMQSIAWINNLKIRASYGQTGSQAIQPLATLSIPIVDPDINYPFTGETATVGVAPSTQLANPDLTWETTTQSNIGFDLGLWENRLTFTLDLYQKNTTDLLLNRVLPSYVGPTVVTQNIGEVENKGFDISLGTVILQNSDWNITSILSVSRNVNKVLALVNENEPMELGNIYYGNTFPVNPTRVEVGKPISSFRGYVYQGVYQLGEEEEAARYGKVPGQAKYEDVNNDGIISSDDIVTVGDGNPAFTWGWNWTIAWRNLDLNFLVLGTHGNDIYNFQRMKMMGLGSGQFHAVHADYKNRWTPENQSNVPSGRDGTEFLSNDFIEDGSFVSMKHLTLGYTFDNVLRSIGMSALRLYFSAENLFIITNYSGYDPESTASGNSDVDLGIDFNAYPINRSFLLGLRATF